VKRKFRLRLSKDIQRVRQKGKSWAHPLVVVVALRSEESFTHLGVIASQRVGSAVIRNVVKRRIKSCLDNRYEQIFPGWDLLFIARQPATAASYKEIDAAILYLLEQANLIRDR
jgi:ribonuclease P protein component